MVGMLEVKRKEKDFVHRHVICLLDIWLSMLIVMLISYQFFFFFLDFTCWLGIMLLGITLLKRLSKG